MGAWGDNGNARPTTKEYSEGWDKIFGKKDEEKDSKDNTVIKKPKKPGKRKQAD